MTKAPLNAYYVQRTESLEGQISQLRLLKGIKRGLHVVIAIQLLVLLGGVIAKPGIRLFANVVKHGSLVELIDMGSVRDKN